MTHPTEPRVEVTQADRDLAAEIFDLQERPAMAEFTRSGLRDNSNTVRAISRHRTAAEAANRDVVERLRHIATDLLQHIDWLTKGLPALLESGGLADEEGLIGAAVDAAASARAALSPTATGEGE